MAISGSLGSYRSPRSLPAVTPALTQAEEAAHPYFAVQMVSPEATALKRFLENSLFF